MRRVHFLWIGIALLVTALLVTLYETHEAVLPKATCVPCHGVTVFTEEIMDESRGAFTGPDACEPCHQYAYHRWTKSDHCRAMMGPAPSTIAGHFSADTVEYSYRDFHSAMILRDGKYFMIAPNKKGQPEEFPIHLALGIRDQQALLTKFPDGRYQILPTAYDIRNQTWFESSEGIVRTTHMLRPNEPFYWTNWKRTWNYDCFGCHLSGMEKNYDPETNTYNTKWRDLGIDCEACHGPGRAHARLRTVKKLWGGLVRDTTMLRLTSLSPRKQVETCGACHASKSTLALGYKPGDDWTEYYTLTLLDHDFIMPDGRYAGLIYDLIGFMQSPCYEKGGLTCITCHSGHADERSIELRHYEHQNDMCRPCHADKVENPQAHTFHPNDSPGSTCRNCHMQILPVSRMGIVDHTISIPTPENTIAFNSPNACQSENCHPNETPQWSIATLKRWHGPNRIDRWTRAQVLFKGKTLDPAGVPGLVAMLADTANNMIWRATAARMLGNIGDARAVPVLRANIDAPDPMLRWQVANALGNFVHDQRVFADLQNLLRRERHSQIRVAVASKLGYWWRRDLNLTPAEKEIARQTWEQYVRQMTTAHADDPIARNTLGMVYMRRGEFDRAIREFQISLRIEPGSSGVERNLADVYTAMNRYSEALPHNQRAVELEPDNPHLYDALSFTYLGLGRIADAEREAQRALRLDSRFAPGYVQMARIRHAQGNLAEAHRLLQKAVTLDARNVEAQYLLAKASQELRLRDQAVQAFVNVVALDEFSEFGYDAKNQLATMLPVGAPLPPPTATPAPERPAREGPMRPIDPHQLWPTVVYKSYAPRTTREEVARIPEPASFAASLDSGRAWMRLAENSRLSGATRKAYIDRSVATLSRIHRMAGSDRSKDVEVRKALGYALSVQAERVPPANAPALLARARSVLDGVDTTVFGRDAAAKASLGRSYYRLARAYNETRDYRNAIWAFERAAVLVPNSFTEAISHFFVGTSYDRLGQRQEAIAAYQRSASNPHNSGRGLRCSLHGIKYPFRYFR
ncbi:MAG TPA: tetratricopeptide repeat protein [Candidatus Latescibacteria bacterium]|nr:tetratricopeptide repeat protein [Candidatus Latescibacterota bacterium]